MTCPRCRHENPPRSMFCLECGARLVLRCSLCGAELPEGSKFCNECGVIAISRPASDVANEATAVVFAAELESWEGKYETAACLYDQGIRLARTHGVLVPVLEGLFMAGVNFTGQGDYDRAMSVLEDGLGLAQKVGDENYTPRYLNSLGWLFIECGGLERALELNQRAAEQAWKRGSDHESIANADLNLADIALRRGDLALAREFLERIHRLVDDPATSEWMRWRWRLHLYASLADFALIGGDLGDARRFAERCLAEATRTRSRKYIVRGQRLLGEIALARRQWADAASSLHAALTVAAAIGNPTQLWKTHVALARLANATGNADDARRELETADRIIGALATRVRNPELRALLREHVKVPGRRHVIAGPSHISLHIAASRRDRTISAATLRTPAAGPDAETRLHRPRRS